MSGSQRKVYVTHKIPEAGLSILRKEGCELDIGSERPSFSKEELIVALRKKPYDAVICLLTDVIDAEVFDAAPRAKIFANYAVGFNNIDVEEAKKRGITITNTPGALTEAVAEHTVALMLAISRRVVESDRFMRDGSFTGWGPELFLGEELQGKTLGILGAGRIGGRVAEIVSRGFGMKVIYYDVKQSSELEHPKAGGPGASFRATPEEVLKEADIVSLHVPLLPSTTHLINKERLALMKRGAYLINTSRGAVIDESALVDALKRGTIRGAALDVFEHEPSLASGLRELQNVVLTAHIASATALARNSMATLAAENIVAFFKGEKPQNIVSP